MRAREVGGFVRRGEDFVAGALVRVEPSPGFAAGKGTGPLTTLTNVTGFFGGLRPVALRYDLSARLGEDLLYYRNVAGRYIEPSLEGPRVFSRAYTARADVRLDRAVPEDRSLAFFVTGAGVLTVSGDLSSGLSVLQQKYTSRATIHVVEYETSGGFEKTSAYGKADVTLDAGAVRLASVVLEPIPFVMEPGFSIAAPPGFAPTEVEVRLAFMRTSDALLTRVPVGSTRSIPAIPNASYTYRVAATLDGAVSDTGENLFNPAQPVTEIELPAPPIAASPVDGEIRGAGETLLVDGEGVFEHVLVPESGERAIRIITRQRAATLPDPAALGARPASGPHTWTVRSFPSVRFAEELAGLDVRRYRAMGVSRPRSIVLR